MSNYAFGALQRGKLSAGHFQDRDSKYSCCCCMRDHVYSLQCKTKRQGPREVSVQTLTQTLCSIGDTVCNSAISYTVHTLAICAMQIEQACLLSSVEYVGPISGNQFLCNSHHLLLPRLLISFSIQKPTNHLQQLCCVYLGQCTSAHRCMMIASAACRDTKLCEAILTRSNGTDLQQLKSA